MTVNTAATLDIFGVTDALSQDERREIRRKELGNLLNSYADEADIFAEILQNAVDSVLSAINNKLYGADETPQVIVFLGRRTNDTHYFCVFDNGLGMEPELARTFTIPGKSEKKSPGKTIGHKGVGASFFVAASDRFALHSQGQSGQTTAFTVSGAYSWIKNASDPMYAVSDSAELPDIVKKHLPSTRGTAVCYYFHAGWKPTSLSYVVKLHNEDPGKEIGNWASYLCSKTSLGQVHNIAQKNIQVRFVLDRGGGESHAQDWSFGDFDRTKRVLGYAYPHRVFQVARDVSELDGMSTPKRDQLRNTLQALKLRWTKSDIDQLAPPIDFTTDEQNLVDTHLDFMDLFFAYSTDVMDAVRDRLGAKASAFRYGIRIAVDGVPQGRMMDFSLTSSQGLDRQMHALIAFTELTLDTGRKIPSAEIVGDVVRKLGTRVASHIKDYRIYMKRKDAPPPSHNLADWRAHVTNQQKGSLVAQLFGRIGSEAPIRIDPENENDTIALFVGLVAAGQLKGFSVASLSGYNAYDGLVDIEVDDPKLHEAGDELSIRTLAGHRGGALKVLEFKHVFDSVLDDFEQKKKDAKDIDVLVCWDLPSMRVRRGTFEYWYADKVDLREMYGATHIWRDDNSSTDIVVLSLKHVIAQRLDALETKDGNPGIGRAKLEELLKQDQEDSV